MLSSQLRLTLTCRGYCSPEYALHGHVSTALDVYSFGILILEVVSGRKSIDLSKPEEEMYIRDWVRTNYSSYLICPLFCAHEKFNVSCLMLIYTFVVCTNFLLNYVFKFNFKSKICPSFLIELYILILIILIRY